MRRLFLARRGLSSLAPKCGNAWPPLCLRARHPHLHCRRSQITIIFNSRLLRVSNSSIKGLAVLRCTAKPRVSQSSSSDGIPHCEHRILKMAHRNTTLSRSGSIPVQLVSAGEDPSASRFRIQESRMGLLSATDILQPAFSLTEACTELSAC